MKRHALILIAIAAFTTALTTHAYGQTGKTVRTNVKFDFQIGDRIFPAGEYQIESISRHPDIVLQIRSLRDANKTELIVTHPSNAARTQTPKLIFQKYGESYFLTEIFLDSGQWGYSIRPSRHQRESEKNLASRLPRNNRKL